MEKIICIYIAVLLLNGCMIKKQPDQISMKKSEDIHFIDYCYWENSNTAFFHSEVHNVLYKKISLYQTAWFLRLIHFYSLPIKSDMKKVIREGVAGIIDNYQPEINILYDIFLIATIHDIVQISDNNINWCISQLLKHLDEQGLFYFTDKNENLSEKLNATNLVLQIFTLLKQSLPDKEKTYNLLYQLLTDDTHFLTSDVKADYVNTGSPLINGISFFANIPDIIDSDILQNRKNWFLYWSSQIIKDIQQADTPTVSIFLNEISLMTLETAAQLHVQITLPDQYIDTLKMQIKQIFDTPSVIAIDPQVLFKIILLLKNFKVNTALFYSKIEQIVYDYWNNGWYKIPPLFNLEENYYGILVAQSLLYSFNRTKMLHIIYTININDLKVREMYYYIATLMELKVYNKNQNHLIKNILLSQVKVINYDKPLKFLEELFYILKVAGLLDVNYNEILDPYMLVRINNYFNKIKPQLDYEQLFYYYVTIITELDYFTTSNLNYNWDSTLLGIDQQDLRKRIDSFWVPQTGGFSISSKKVIPNIISTWRLLEIYKLLGEEFPANKYLSVMDFVQS